ncbi:hypothetical protein HYV10_03510 [Candidatus Dependentiae bacterium]|nr:hypothetical protein [Candidatus Dependentiae bacterium]
MYKKIFFMLLSVAMTELSIKASLPRGSRQRNNPQPLPLNLRRPANPAVNILGVPVTPRQQMGNVLNQLYAQHLVSLLNAPKKESDMTEKSIDGTPVTPPLVLYPVTPRQQMTNDENQLHAQHLVSLLNAPKKESDMTENPIDGAPVTPPFVLYPDTPRQQMTNDENLRYVARMSALEGAPKKRKK